MLTAVLFALVLFFAAVSDRARGRRSRVLLFGLAVAGLLMTIAVLATFPVKL